MGVKSPDIHTDISEQYHIDCEMANIPTTVPTSILAANSQRRGDTESLSDVAYRRIREKIVSLELPPASLIDESTLAEEIGVGLTPVRQALRKLSFKSLVVILPRRGTLVADLNSSDLQKIFEMRLELETLAARLAAKRATHIQIVAMEALMQEALSLVEESNNHELLDIDHKMHILIAEAAHNEFLEESVDWLYCHVQRLWNVRLHHVGNMDHAMQEHNAILKAIRTGDAERASHLMSEHVNRFQIEFSKTF